MYIIKIAGHTEESGERFRYAKSVRDFTIDGDSIIMRVFPDDYTTLALNDRDRIYIMDAMGNNVDKYIVDTGK